MTIDSFLSRIQGVKREGVNHWTARCPNSDKHKNNDDSPSFSISFDDKTKNILCYCHTGCTIEEICSAVGCSVSDLMGIKSPWEKINSFCKWYAGQKGFTFVEVYDYNAPYNDGLYKAKFLQGKGAKTFRWIHEDESKQSGFSMGAIGEKRLFACGSLEDDRAFLCEGEKDAITLHKITSRLAVCSPDGATKGNAESKWVEEYSLQLQGKRVYLFWDNDEAGRNFRDIEIDQLLKYAKSITPVDILAIWPECPEKGDITDAVNALGLEEVETRIRNQILCADTLVWDPDKAPEQKQDTESFPAEAPKLFGSSDSDISDEIKFNSGVSIDSHFAESRLEELNPAVTFPFNTLDDIAAAQLFKAVFGDYIRYNATTKSWYVYDGIHWKPDPGDMTVETCAKILSRALWVYSADVSSKEFQQFVFQMQQRRRRRTMIDDARDLVPVLQTDFDKDPDLFNCQNCVINLKTLEAIPHDPKLLLSKVANVDYNPGARSILFEGFLDQIMMGDREKTAYLQELFGYAMTGTNEREEAYMLYGCTTRNGKGTLTNTINYLFGDYGANIQPESLAMQKNKDGRTASGDIARLNGVRFLQMSEPPKRMKIDVALLKTLLGRDVVTARHLYEREFEFTPCFKLFINTNFLPVVMDDTLFSSGRVKVITFDRHFEEAEQDKTLKDRLQTPEELSGILNWLMMGLKRYHMDGKKIAVPEAVRYATEDYRRKSDKIQNFINETYEPSPSAAIQGKFVYENYVDWCHSNGYGVENKTNFFDELRAKGILSDTGTVGGKTYKNVVKGYTWA